MTWILGWPLTVAYAKEYCIKEGLFTEEEQADPQFDWKALQIAGHHIPRRAGMPYLHRRACWVNGRLATVFQLAADRKAQTAEEAKIRRDVPVEPARELGRLLGATEAPQWYIHNDREHYEKSQALWAAKQSSTGEGGLISSMS